MRGTHKMPTSVRVAPKTISLGETVTIAWTYSHPLQADQSLWARTDCILDEDGSVGFTAFERLGDPEADTVTPGITPSWTGTPATCRVTLVLFDNGRSRDLNADDSFRVE